MRQRPGQKVFVNPDPSWGVWVVEPGFPSAAGGWWDDFGGIGCCVAAYQPKGAVSLAASYVDLTGNGNNCGPGVAPGWNPVQGWIFTGIEWLDTGITPVNNQIWSVLVQYTNSAGANAEVFGLTTGAAGFMIRPFRTGANIGYRNGGNLNVAPGQVNGNAGFAGNQGYRNGIADGGAIPPAGGAFVGTVYIGCGNTGGPWDMWTGEVQAFAIYDCTNTAPQMAAVAAAMAAI